MRAKLVPVLILLFALAGCGMQTQAASSQKVVARSRPHIGSQHKPDRWTSWFPYQPRRERSAPDRAVWFWCHGIQAEEYH